MAKLEKLNKLYEYAIAKSLCTNRKTFATLIGKSETSISSAFSSETSRYLTNNLLVSINEKLGSPFNMAWLIYDEGEMMRHDTQAGDTIIGDGNATRGSNVTYSAAPNAESYERMRIELEYAKQRIEELLKEKQELLDTIIRMTRPQQ